MLKGLSPDRIDGATGSRAGMPQSAESEESRQRQVGINSACCGERPTCAYIPLTQLRIVGTNTLRLARNSAEFLARAEAVLGHTVEIISGPEEARR